MTLLGQFALWAAFAIGLWCVLLSFSGRWEGRPELSATIVRSVYAIFGCLIVASLALWQGLVTHDFNIEYVWAYTSRNLPSSTSFQLFGRARKALCFSGPWCSPCSPARRSYSPPGGTPT
jgi:cytochrome c biogenesis factor